MLVNVISIKWGNWYGPHYVNRLFSGVKRNLTYDFRFVCFTENTEGLLPEIETYPLPPVNREATGHFGRGLKQGLFNSGIGDLRGPCLYFDLDIVIVDSIDCFFDYLPGKFCICKEWFSPPMRLRNRLVGRQADANSSIFRFEANSMHFVVDAMNKDNDLPKRFSLEQSWLTYIAGDRINWWPLPWIASFKHRQPAFPLSLVFPPVLPSECRVMVFNGPLKPQDAIQGNFDFSPRRVCLPTPWIAEHWID